VTVIATARRVGLAAWKKRGGDWGMEIGPGIRRLTPGRTAGKGSREREDGSETPERRGRRRCWWSFFVIIELL
jgi:hypothetical protein